MSQENPYSLKAPIHAYLELTQACNLKCRHCFNSTRFSDQCIPEGNIENIITRLIDWDIMAVTISGGEALLRKPQLYAALKLLSEADISLSLNTNLTLLDEDDIRKLREYNLTGILTSLHSSRSKEHDLISGQPNSFSKTIQNIEAAALAGIPLCVNLVGSKYTKNNIPEMGKLISDLGATAFTVSPIIPNPNLIDQHISDSLSSDELMPMLWDLYNVGKMYNLGVGLQRAIPFCFFWEYEELRSIGNRSCNAEYSLVNIRSDGTATGCTALNNSYGNIITDNLENIWKNIVESYANRFSFDACKTCDLVKRCNSGCKAENIAYGSKVKHPLITGPIRLDEPSCTKIERGMVLNPSFKQIRFREETKGAYTLIKEDGSHYVVPTSWFNILKSVSSSKGIKVDESLLNEERIIMTLEAMVKANLLDVSEVTK